MNLLVTGSTGFLGQYLIENLAETYPDKKIHSIGRGNLAIKGVQHHQIDLTEAKPVASLLEQIKPTQVYHLAGISRVSDQIEVKNYFLQNSLTTQILLESLTRLNQPVDFFLASSVHVYGNQTGLISEKSELNPESPYGFSKYLAEETLKNYVQENPQIKGVIGRIYSCFGPRQPKGFVAADVCEKIRLLPQDRKGVLQVGPIDTFRRFLDVRDAVRIFPKLLELPNRSRLEIFNIASPHELTIGKIIDILLKIAGTEAEVQSSGSSANMFKGLRVDISKLEQFISPASFRPVETTLKDMLMPS